MTPRPLRAKQAFGDAANDEPVVAELAARVQALEEELETVRAERNRLEIELLVARGWIQELAVWLGADMNESLVRTLVTRPLDRIEVRGSWRTVATVVAASAALWALVAALVLLAWRYLL